MGCAKNQRKTVQDPEVGSGRIGRTRWFHPEENVLSARKDSLPPEVLIGFSKVLQTNHQRPPQARRRPNKYLCLNLGEIPVSQAKASSEERETMVEPGVSLSERREIEESGRRQEIQEVRPTLITENEENRASDPEEYEKPQEFPFSLAAEEVLGAEEPAETEEISSERAENAQILPNPPFFTDVQSPKGRERVITEASDYD